jgi:hypothetical protein
MRTKGFACFLDRFDQCVGEFLVSKMFAHSFNELPPKCLPALFVDRLIADDCELVRARRHENEDGIAFRRLVHSEPMKLFLRGDKWIGIHLATLNVNANLAGSFRFGVADRLHDPIMLEFTEKFFRSHRITNSSPRRRRRNCRRRR